MVAPSLAAIDALIGEDRLGEALAGIEALSAREGLDAQGEFMLGLVLGRTGNPVAAREAFRRCVGMEPGVASAWRSIAALSYQIDDFESVVAALEKYRDLAPYDRTALGWAIFALAELRRPDEALSLIEGYLQVFPYEAALRPMLAFIFERQDRYLNALLVAGQDSEGDLSTSISGQILLTCSNNLGNDALCESYMDIVFPDRAARESDSAYAKSKADLASLRGDLTVASDWMEKSILLGNEERDAVLNLALLQISCGEYRKGWLSYRARHSSWKHLLLPGIPEWNGEALAGKTVIVHSEQGCGDVIQFIRYLPYLRQTGATIIFNSYPDILELLRHDPRARTGESLSADVIDHIDFQTFLMEFPVLLRPNGILDFPDDVPYLFAPSEKVAYWHERLSCYDRFKIGIVWAGNPQHANDHNRSSALGDFVALACVPGVKWFSLQKGPRAGDSATEGAGLQLINLNQDIRDFSDTAAIIANLDLVICVDTSVAHLAGAMGRPCWILLPEQGEDWRWRLEQQSAPWYPSVRLFKQCEPGDWPRLFREEVVPALAEEILKTWGGRLSQSDRIGLEWLAGSEVSANSLDLWASELSDSDLHAQMVKVARHLALYRSGLEPLAVLQRSDVTRGRVDVRSATAELQVQRGDWEAALAEWNSIPVMDGLPMSGWVAWGDVLLRRGNNLNAAELAEQAMAQYGLASALLVLAGHASYNATDYDAAQTWYEKALNSSPRNYHACMGLGRIFRIKRDNEVAADYMQRAIQLRPREISYWKELAQFALDIGANPLAEKVARWILEVEPNSAIQICLVRAVAGQGRVEAASEVLERVDYSSVQNAEDLLTLANLLIELRMDPDAENVMRRMVQLYPTVTEGHLALGAWLLARGRFDEGWEEYRLGLPKLDIGIPEWCGEDLSGKSLLIYQDQGHGDLLQFLPLVRQLPPDANITIAVFGDVFEFVQAQALDAKVVRREKVLSVEGEFDFQIPLMHMPRMLRLNLLQPPLSFPYYRIPTGIGVGQCYDRLLNDRNFKIGIVWAGSRRHANDRHRSTSLEDWLPLAKLEGVSLYSLQKDAASNQAYAVPQLKLHNLAAECDSMLKTAAAIAELDLVISVDSGVAHLAAGIGKETWIMIPEKWPDFRWQLDREDCPWYPSVRLFRREPGQSWKAVLEGIALALCSRGIVSPISNGD